MLDALKITLPYLRIVKQYEHVSQGELDQALREGLAASEEHPAYMEVSGGSEHCFVFFRNGQIYNAGAVRSSQFVATTIREFFLTANRATPARAVLCEVDDKTLHSLLILSQKKPTLKLLTSLVDLDQVLDKIEEDGKSCIVAASQGEFLAILRYERGRVTALCHELSAPVPHERSFREDFLVKIYTLSAEKPLSINIYEDLLVKYAQDARVIDRSYRGKILDLYVSKPPVVTLQFKGKEIGHWMLDKAVFKIGRSPENDIVIDNLAVSRIHSVIEEEKGKRYIKDLDSLNGTIVNGRRVGRSLLNDGDQIQIGKHELCYHEHGSRLLAMSPDNDEFDQTVIREADRRDAPGEKRESTSPRARLVEKDGNGNRVFEIGDSSLTMGSDRSADVEIAGFLVAKRHAEISRENGHYILRHLGGARKVTVGGKPVREWVLKSNDRIRIGKREFVFQQ